MSDILDYFEEGWPAILGVPDEWLPAIYDLHEYIKWCDEIGAVKNYKIQQVKLKFNELRFYYTVEEITSNMYGKAYIDRIRGAVALTEMRCSKL